MQQRALIQVAARRFILFLAARTRKGRGAGGKKAARRLWHFYVSVDLMGAAGFLLRFQRIDLHFSSAAGRGSRTRKVLNKYSPVVKISAKNAPTARLLLICQIR